MWRVRWFEGAFHSCKKDWQRVKEWLLRVSTCSLGRTNDFWWLLTSSWIGDQKTPLCWTSDIPKTSPTVSSRTTYCFQVPGCCGQGCGGRVGTTVDTFVPTLDHVCGFAVRTPLQPTFPSYSYFFTPLLHSTSTDSSVLFFFQDQSPQIQLPVHNLRLFAVGATFILLYPPYSLSSFSAMTLIIMHLPSLAFHLPLKRYHLRCSSVQI